MRGLIILLLLIAMFIAKGTAAQATGSADAVLAEVRSALDNGNAGQARQLIEGALKEPDLTPLQRARLLLDRGLAWEVEGQHDQALVDLTAAINVHVLPAPEQAQATLQRGFLLDSMGRLDDALGDYSAVVGLTPKAAQAALNNRANIYRRQNRLKDARRDYLAALDGGNPHPEYPYTGLGQIAEAQGDVEAARRYYAQAIAANAHYAPAIDRLAALGGPPPDTVADSGTVHLRPPGAKPKPVDPPFVLTPPPDTKPAESPPDATQGAAADPELAPIHLHMPPKKAQAQPAAAKRAMPILRPAIDSSGGAAGHSLVQLGAWRSRAEAQAAWKRAVSRAGGPLDGLAPVIVAADLPGKGRYYRLRVAPAQGGARALCDTLQARGLDCLIARN